MEGLTDTQLIYKVPTNQAFNNKNFGTIDISLNILFISPLICL